MRTIVDIPQQRIDQLDRIARTRGQSRAAAIRHAVDQFVDANEVVARTVALDALFARIKPGQFGEDGVVYQQRIRAEWDREWD
jgi:predicted transcriptional regulator